MQKDTFLEALFTSMTEAVLLCGEEGDIILANPKGHEVFGYAPDTLIHTSVDKLFPARYQNRRKIIQKALKEKAVRTVKEEMICQRRDGTEFPVKITTIHFLEDEKNYFVHCILDLSGQKQTEQNLKEVKKELQSIEKLLQTAHYELDQFNYISSHDLKEPLRMVTIYTQLLSKKFGEALDEEALEFLSYAEEGAARMNTLINNLLQFSQISKTPPPCEAVDANLVFQRACRNLQSLITRTEAEIEVDILPEICYSAQYLEMLFENLLENGIKFQKSGEKPHIRVYCEPAPEFWHFYFEDNGIGIPKQYQAKIFEVFKRLHPREAFTGTGMGLPLCKKIIQYSGGNIGLHSTPGEGSTFFFSLPRKKKDAAPEPLSRAPQIKKTIEQKESVQGQPSQGQALPPQAKDTHAVWVGAGWS